MFSALYFTSGLSTGLIIGFILGNFWLGLGLGAALGLTIMGSAKNKKDLLIVNRVRVFGLLALAMMIIIILVSFSGSSRESTIANPSATYCVEQGYTYEIRETSLGSNGFCIFDDNTECEGWAYYRGECTKETASPCADMCGDDICQVNVCLALGCPCAENETTCPSDCN